PRTYSTARSVGDRDLAVLDADLVGAQTDRVVELVQSRAHVVLPTVPGAGEDGVLQMTFGERALQVEAVALNGVHLSADVREGDLLALDLDVLHPPWRNLFRAGDGDEPLCDHRATRSARFERCAPWRTRP